MSPKKITAFFIGTILTAVLFGCHEKPEHKPEALRMAWIIQECAFEALHPLDRTIQITVKARANHVWCEGASRNGAIWLEPWTAIGNDVYSQGSEALLIEYHASMRARRGMKVEFTCFLETGDEVRFIPDKQPVQVNPYEYECENANKLASDETINVKVNDETIKPAETCEPHQLHMIVAL